MGRLVTLSEIRSEVQERYELPTFSASTWTTTTAINRNINESLQRFYALLSECYGDGYFLTSRALTTTANYASTSLPNDFFKLVALSWRKDATTSVPIARGTVHELRSSALTPREWSMPKYVLTGAALTWYPVPSAEYTVDCWYKALPADLSDDADTFDAGPGWLEWVILDVCRKLSAREQKDPTRWIAEQQIAERLVRDQAPDRAESDAASVRDVMGTQSLGDAQLRDLATYGDF